MKKILSLLICMTLLLSCITPVSFISASATEFEIDSLEQYVVYNSVMENDGYIGIPVGIKTYIKETPDADTPVIMYVVNTNTKRVGTDTDENIITDFLNRGYVVVVLDYYNNEKTVCPDLDWSLQGIKSTLRTTSGMNTYLSGNVANDTYVYILPAGYSVARQLVYWSIDKHSYSGTQDYIISVWNSDFLAVRGDSEVITFAQDTKIIKGKGESEYLEFEAGQSLTPNEYTAMLTDGKVTDITQCIKRDGTPIDMDLYMDIVYPANPENEVPVLMYAQSTDNTVGTWNTAERPHVTGFLFRGYAAALYEFEYVPMGSSDNYGYYDGNGGGIEGGITGDNMTYALGVTNGIKVDTSAVRFVRYLADMKPLVYKFDEDKYGAMGISKSGQAIRLGHPDPESLPEMRIFENQCGKTRYESGETEDIVDLNGNTVMRGAEPQPWLEYNDGSKIPSNVQFTSTTVGSGMYSITDGMAPMYIYGTIRSSGSQWAQYPDMLARCYTHDIPTMYYEGIDIGHALCYGADGETGNDTYEALFTTADYWLRDTGVKCEYIKPLNGAVDVKATDDIIVKFSGPVSEEEISKIKIKNDITGEIVSGEWKDTFGDTEWTFTPYNLKGFHTYTVYVPSNVVGKNGKTIMSAKSSSFTVEPEELASATYTSENMTASTDNGVYFEVDGADIENSITTAVRFSVKNDAANTALIYSADENGEADELLGSVVLTGAGEYDVDVTDYARSLEAGEKAAFVIKAEKETEEKIVYNMDFEGLTSIPGTVRINTDGPTREISKEMNSTDGGDSSYKVVKFNTTTKYEPYHRHYDNFELAASFMPFGSTFEDEDYGRKFNVKFKLYDTESRYVQVSVGETTSNKINDGNAYKHVSKTNANVWNEYEVDFRLTGNLFKNKTRFRIATECFGTESENKPFYIDDCVFTESITDIELASESDNLYVAPSLVLHPSEKQSVNVLSAGYVESGMNSGTSFEAEDTLLVSGRSKSMSLAGDKKVIARVDLSTFNPSMANNVVINIKSGNGAIDVYGVTDEIDILNANYINTFANDRFSSGVDLSKVYGGAPLTAIDVNGAGQHSFDITQYAQYMIDKGKNNGYLIFVSKTEASPVVYSENFNDGTLDGEVMLGGGMSEHGIDETVDIDNSGSAYKAVSGANYHRIFFDFFGRDDWTEADIGREFEITYWFKADGAGTFLNRMQLWRADDANQVVTQNYTTANEWQKFTYNFVYNQECFDNDYDCFGFRFATLPNNTVYIDNITIRETSIGNINFEFVAETPEEGAYYYKNDCDSDSFIYASSTASGIDDIVKEGVIAGYQGIKATVGEACSLSTDENYPVADGTKKSLYLSSLYDWDRIFVYNVIDSLTEDDIGRVFNISFYAKANQAGTFDTSISNVSGYKTYDYNKVTHSVTADDVGKWKKFTYNVTVTEDMVTNNTGLIKFTTFEFQQEEDNLLKFYLDDITSMEKFTGDGEAKVAYSYAYSFDETGGYTWGGFEKIELEDGTKVNRVNLVDTDDRIENSNAKGSLEIITNKNYNRAFIRNVFESLTTEDIGRKYRVSFWLKSDTAGTINASMSNTDLSGNAYDGEIKHPAVIEASDVGEWKKFTFDITVDEYMVTQQTDLLMLKVGDITSNSTVEATVYVDDFKSVELLDGASTQLIAEAYKTISSAYLSDAEAAICSLAKASEYGVAAAGIRKSYISFEGSDDYKKAQRATLNFDIAEANGQTLKVYALINCEYPEELTYNTAPASNADETINESLAYGALPVAEVVATEGIKTIDVSEYIKNTAPAKPLFVIVSDATGGTQYITLDFESMKLTNGIDYVAQSDITITEGAAKISGNEIQLFNIFGNANASVKAGETYEISLDVTSDNDSVISIGAAKKNGEMVGDVATVNAIAENEQTVKFKYTATSQDEADGVCSVVVESIEEGFSIDNLQVSSTTAVVINKTAELVIEVAKVPEFDELDSVKLNVSITDGDALIINGENKGTSATYDVHTGTVLDMEATGDGIFMYWLDAKSNTILSYDENYSFTAGTDRSLVAVYASESDVFVTFTSMASKVIAAGVSITVPENPYVYGYQFEGWYTGGVKSELNVGDDVNVTESTNYVAGFIKDTTEYSVVVDGENASYKYNEKVKVSADSHKDDKEFSYWKRDGIIVSYSKDYSFYVNGDTTLESVYGESVSEKAVLAMAPPVLVGDDKIAFFTECDIPLENEVIEKGIIIGTASGLEIQNAEYKAVSKNKENKSQFTVRKIAEPGDTYYAAAYVIYRDASGNVITAYSNEVSYTLE